MSTEAVLRETRRALGSVVVDRLTAQECASLVAELARTEKACAGLRALVAARLSSIDPTKGPGWLSRRTGTTSSRAKRETDAASVANRCPKLADAMRDGSLSLEQASEIARTEQAVPGSGDDLVDAAKALPLESLKDRTRDIRLSSVDREELHRRQHALRSVRKWTDEDGMCCGRWRLPPEEGAAFHARLEKETDRVFRAAYKEGRREANEAYAADAFLRIVNGQCAKGRTDVVFVCDVETGDSHIVGYGPVPASVVREKVKDAFIKAVTHDGVDVRHVAHYGRGFTAQQMTALVLGDPPLFDGMACVDCGNRLGVQLDHDNPVANGGETSVRNNRYRCSGCHQAKTERDRRQGKLRGRSNEERGP